MSKKLMLQLLIYSINIHNKIDCYIKLSAFNNSTNNLVFSTYGKIDKLEWNNQGFSINFKYAFTYTSGTGFKENFNTKEDLYNPGRTYYIKDFSDLSKDASYNDLITETERISDILNKYDSQYVQLIKKSLFNDLRNRG